MKYMKQHTGSVIVCLFEILVGILLLVNPVGFTAGIITAGGILLIVVGIASIISYARLDPVAGAASQSLVKGLVALCAGLFCAFKAEWFIITFPVLTLVYGVVILISGLAKVQWTVDILRLKMGKWFLPAISAALSIICAFIIFANPLATTVWLWVFTGVALIVEAIFDIVSMVFLGREMV